MMNSLDKDKEENTKERDSSAENKPNGNSYPKRPPSPGKRIKSNYIDDHDESIVSENSIAEEDIDEFSYQTKYKKFQEIALAQEIQGPIKPSGAFNKIVIAMVLVIVFILLSYLKLLPSALSEWLVIPDRTDADILPDTVYKINKQMTFLFNQDEQAILFSIIEHNKSSEYPLPSTVKDVLFDNVAMTDNIYELLQITKARFNERRDDMSSFLESKSTNIRFSEEFIKELNENGKDISDVNGTLSLSLINKSVELTDYQAMALIQAYSEMMDVNIAQISVGDYLLWLGYSPEKRETCAVDFGEAIITVNEWKGTFMPQYLVDEASIEAAKYAESVIAQNDSDAKPTLFSDEYNKAYKEKFREYTDKYGVSALDIMLCLTCTDKIENFALSKEKTEIFRKEYENIDGYKDDKDFTDKKNLAAESSEVSVEMIANNDVYYKCEYINGYFAGVQNPYYESYKDIYRAAVGSLAGWNRVITPKQEKEGIPLYSIDEERTGRNASYTYVLYSVNSVPEYNISIEIQARTAEDFMYFCGLWAGNTTEEQQNLYEDVYGMYGRWAELSTVSPITTYKIRKSGRNAGKIEWEERDYPNFVVPGRYTETYTTSAGRLFYVYKQTDPEWAGIPFGEGNMYSSGCTRASAATIMSGYGYIAAPDSVLQCSLKINTDLICMNMNEAKKYYGAQNFKETIIKHLSSGNAFIAATTWEESSSTGKNSYAHNFPIIDIRINNDRYEVYGANTCTGYGDTITDDSLSFPFKGHQCDTCWYILDEIVPYISLAGSVFVFDTASS